MKDWKEYFLEATIERGYSYFIEKQVNNFKFKKNLVTASVSDKESHNIVIETTKNGHFEKMVCDCSCLSNEECPHLVAVLFEYNKYLQNKSINNITYLVSSAYESQIRHFLKVILKENKQLAQLFQRHIFSDEQLDLKKYIDKDGNVLIPSPVDNDSSNTLNQTKKELIF